MRRFRLTFAATALLGAAPAIAHHSPAGYDMQKQVTIAGTVTGFEWANPHAYLSVEDESAAGRTWLIELVSPSALKQFGWSPATLAKGDRVTVTASPARNPARSTAFMHSIEKSGVVLYTNPQRVAGPPPGSAPNAAGGGPPPNAAPPVLPSAAGGLQRGGEPAFSAESLAGTWATLSGPALGQLLANAFQLPTTARGTAAIQGFTDAAGNPGQDCVPFPPPVYMILPVFRSIEIGRDAVTIRGEEGAVDRTIHTNRSTHDGATASLLGDSIGRWDGAALVIDTTHFAEHALGNAAGLPSSTRKHLVERFELAPGGAELVYTFTLEDPEYLTAPVQGMSRWKYRPDVTYAAIECNLDNARKFLEE